MLKCHLQNNHEVSEREKIDMETIIAQEKQWFNAFDSYGEEFEKACPHYEQLDPKIQIIGSLMKLEIDMYNGGFIQFFCNWGYGAYLLAMDGLEKIDAPNARNLLSEAFSVINKYEDNERIKSYWDLPTILSDEDRAKLDRVDQEYWKDEDSIMEKMLNCFS
jgi:hypothetical protein